MAGRDAGKLMVNDDLPYASLWRRWLQPLESVQRIHLHRWISHSLSRRLNRRYPAPMQNSTQGDPGNG